WRSYGSTQQRSRLRARMTTANPLSHNAGTERQDQARATHWRQNRGVNRSEDPRLSFNAAVAMYDEIRPNYPAAMFDDLFELLPLQPDIVEVGPGTGQATKDLLARGGSV